MGGEAPAAPLVWVIEMILMIWASVRTVRGPRGPTASPPPELVPRRPARKAFGKEPGASA
jgi:hypothetical protein